ncbi:hypothetical protein CVT25_014319 [Psilocybe cyanescens]|uniref:Transmembrane protein n=1 Tax=Psilocybe cyanescens TaxID=93625 RepID=A0A409XL22_PSICY|nr:hypothetical protein CVT25_014319 [Psilocybe cyanescens]
MFPQRIAEKLGPLFSFKLKRTRHRSQPRPLTPAKRPSLSPPLSTLLDNIASTSRSCRRWPPQNDAIRFLLYWIIIVGTCLIVFVFFALHMTVRPSQFTAPRAVPYDDPFVPDAKVVSVDPVSRTIIMNWYPELVDQDCDVNNPVIVDIFIPTILLDVSSPSYSSGLSDQPVIRVNSTQICFARTQTYISFRTVTKLVASREYLLAQEIGTQRTFQSYPFDIYIAPFSFYTQDVQTGVVKALRISQSFGIAVNFEISLIDTYLAWSSDPNLQFYLRIERSTATKSFVVIVAITNWITAITFLTILASTLVYRPHEIYSEMFVVPVGAVFAFSSVRSNLPGAPTGFGKSSLFSKYENKY